MVPMTTSGPRTIYTRGMLSSLHYGRLVRYVAKANTIIKVALKYVITRGLLFNFASQVFFDQIKPNKSLNIKGSK